jgi:hypothetical protein
MARRLIPPIALPLGLAGLLLAAAPAMAGTAALVTKHYPDPTGDGRSKYSMCEYLEIDYVAASGEANVVTVSSLTTPAGPGQAVIHDAGAPITPGEGCERIDDHAVACPRYAVSIRAGDLDDSVTGGYTLRGGPGDDRISGRGGSDELDGDDGWDRARVDRGLDRVLSVAALF